MLSGTVKRLAGAQGFGFLVDAAGMDWFFVRDGVRGGRFDDLQQDAHVRFVAEWTATGPRATDVHAEPWA